MTSWFAFIVRTTSSIIAACHLRPTTCAQSTRLCPALVTATKSVSNKLTQVHQQDSMRAVFFAMYTDGWTVHSTSAADRLLSKQGAFAILLRRLVCGWRLISATLCGWRRCFVADQLWFTTHIWEEEDWGSPANSGKWGIKEGAV